MGKSSAGSARIRGVERRAPGLGLGAVVPAVLAVIAAGLYLYMASSHGDATYASKSIQSDTLHPMPLVLRASSAPVSFSRAVACRDPIHQGRCGRRVVDDLFEASDIHALLAIAEKGMSIRPSLGGPTILDLNTGYLRDSAGLVNLFESASPAPRKGYSSASDQDGAPLFQDADFVLYERIIRKLKGHVQESFGLDAPIYFTAPTFITRLDGNASWKPRAMHDEYWHVHSDMVNTPHYQYSGLLYMSTYGEDFEGGLFSFVSGDDDASAPVEVVEPRRGRVAIFSSGPENPHRVARVTAGRRLVLSFWFTLDPSREFDIFLDGKAHRAFKTRKQKSNKIAT